MAHKEDNNSDKPLSHFLDNKNFPSARRPQRRPAKPRTADDADLEKGSLAIVNGEVVINDSARDVSPYVEDRVTSFSYGKPFKKRSKWTPEETRLFYAALSVCGTDFTLLERIFSDKDRKQLKNKYNREEKEFPQRISSALRATGKFSAARLEELRQEYIKIKNRDHH